MSNLVLVLFYFHTTNDYNHGFKHINPLSHWPSNTHITLVQNQSTWMKNMTPYVQPYDVVPWPICSPWLKPHGTLSRNPIFIKLHASLWTWFDLHRRLYGSNLISIVDLLDTWTVMNHFYFLIPLSSMPHLPSHQDPAAVMILSCWFLMTHEQPRCASVHWLIGPKLFVPKVHFYLEGWIWCHADVITTSSPRHSPCHLPCW